MTVTVEVFAGLEGEPVKKLGVAYGENMQEIRESLAVLFEELAKECRKRGMPGAQPKIR